MIVKTDCETDGSFYSTCDVARPPVVEAPHAEAGGVQEAVAVPGGGEGPQPLAGPSLRPPVTWGYISLLHCCYDYSGG